jgi:SulP family sulfate permease
MMIAAGVLRLGRYTRFVSVSALTGFLTGVAVNIMLGQLGDLPGSPQKGSPAIVKAWNVATHPSDLSLTAAAVGLSALALMVVLSRTRIAARSRAASRRRTFRIYRCCPLSTSSPEPRP